MTIDPGNTFTEVIVTLLALLLGFIAAKQIAIQLRKAGFSISATDPMIVPLPTTASNGNGGNGTS